jgi:hypothetical protein
VNPDKVYDYRYIPLFSTTGRPADAPFTAPAVAPLVGANANQRIDFTTLPFHDKVRAAWLPVKDESGRTVARYAYWVEDLQSRVDPAIAGNDKGTGGKHARVAWPFPAPGLNDQPEGNDEPALDQIALFALDPEATETSQENLGKTLLENRKLLISPDSQLAAAGIEPPLARLTSASTDGFVGDLIDPEARAVERGLSTNIQAYLERPVIPHAAGIDPSMAGKPKLNLNQLLADDRASAVDEMAEHIKKALPNFESRKGGFPNDYLKTLAANALDYADIDDDPTLGTGFRGIDAYPMVSEFLFKSRWDALERRDGRIFLVFKITIYAELWNMTNQPVSGEAQISYETKYGFQIPPNPNLFRLDDMSRASPQLEEADGYRWLNITNVSLQPNEYRVYDFGTVTYTIDAAPASAFIASPLNLTGESYAALGSGYRLRWNGKIVDQSGGGVHRNDSSLNFPADTKSNPRQRLRTTVPGHSYKRGVTAPFINNMGDPRMSFYIQAPQDANVYPQNYSPNRRNIREGSIYNSNNNSVFGRVLPSEWPDGGHDSPFGSNNVFGLVGMSAPLFEDDHRIDPNAPGFFNQRPDLARGKEEAPTRLSNLGRFYSVAELGRAYDPVMWQVRTTTTNTPGSPWGDVLTSSPSSGDFGGGNTLRVGRPEHQRFNQAGLRATHLLDLFHTGLSRSAAPEDREGTVAEIDGHLNLNTASKPALRQVIAGRLRQNPEMRRFVNSTHSAGINRFPNMQRLPTLPDMTAVADRIADAIVRSRPYASTGELARASESAGTTFTDVFGNPKILPGFTGNSFPIMQWDDSGAEETFARTHEASTVRSRNFRIWVIGQSISPTTSATATPEVLGEVRKAFTVFADPGDRQSDGSINPAEFRLNIIHENDF